nr:MAG TPA: hypothetical protein [Caudoviricetes sp.]
MLVLVRQAIFYKPQNTDNERNNLHHRFPRDLTFRLFL